jgi:aminoglycoside phosphotransferase (APT) family kinase protein
VSEPAAPGPTELLASIGWEAVECAPVTGGWDTLIWRFTTPDGSTHAIRAYRELDGSARATAAYETAVIRALRAASLPVPDIEASGECEGRSFLVQRWIGGVQMKAAIEKSPWNTWRLGRAFGRLQARLHTLRPEGIRVLGGHTEAMVESTAPALLPLLSIDPGVSRFCHMDYHPLNVMVRGVRLSGLLDFSNAAIADPRIDLGRTWGLLLAAPLPADPLKPVLQQVRKVLAAAWKAGYVAESGGWPLTPEYQALGTAIGLAETTRAVAEGRVLDGRLKASGLPIE